MNPDDFAAILDELGERLGPAGERVFELAIRQQAIDGAIWVGALIALFGISLAVSLVARSGMADSNTKHPSGDDKYIPWRWAFGAYAGIWALFLLTFALVGPLAIGKLLNPEYAALRDLLGAIRP